MPKIFMASVPPVSLPLSNLTITVIIYGFSFQAWGQSPMNSLQTTVPVISKAEDNQQITDGKLKAENGSLSQYSLKFNLSFSGPPVGDLSNPNQPNPDGSIGNMQTNIAGSINGRYRFNRETSLSLGSGIKGYTPFQGIQRFDMSTPTLTYDRVFKTGEYQFRNAPGLSIVTYPEYLNVGEFATLNYDASIHKTLGQSRFRLGVETSFGYYLYNRAYEAADKKAQRFNLAFYPGVKYSVSDQLTISTSLNVSFQNPRELKNEFAMLNKTLSQRLGLEYSITREIFIAPYLNFYPKSLSTNSTTLNVNTIFSML
jgi:hypothetical protein